MPVLDLSNYYFAVVYFNNENEMLKNEGFLKFSHQVLKPQKHSFIMSQN